MIKREFNELGKNVTIYEPVTMINPSLIHLKSNIIISEFSYLAGGLGLFIGNFIHISSHTIISGGGYCVLEDFVGLSAGVRIITGSEELNGNGLTNPTIPDEFRSNYKSYVNCKKHSFLATNVIVHPGVTIGEGTVVGSGSVVTKDLEPWSFYMGIPARKVKDRENKKILKMEKEILKKYSVNSSDFKDILGTIKI